jgi:hypothetical protein
MSSVIVIAAIDHQRGLTVRLVNSFTVEALSPIAEPYGRRGQTRQEY